MTQARAGRDRCFSTPRHFLQILRCPNQKFFAIFQMHAKTALVEAAA